MMGKVSQTQLATLLKETCSFLYQNDLDDKHGNIEARVSLYGSLYNVEGVPSGAYSYDNQCSCTSGNNPRRLPGSFYN